LPREPSLCRREGKTRRRERVSFDLLRISTPSDASTRELNSRKSTSDGGENESEEEELGEDSEAARKEREGGKREGRKVSQKLRRTRRKRREESSPHYAGDWLSDLKRERGLTRVGAESYLRWWWLAGSEEGG